MDLTIENASIKIAECNEIIKDLQTKLKIANERYEELVQSNKDEVKKFNERITEMEEKNLFLVNAVAKATMEHEIDIANLKEELEQQRDELLISHKEEMDKLEASYKKCIESVCLVEDNQKAEMRCEMEAQKIELDLLNEGYKSSVDYHKKDIKSWSVKYNNLKATTDQERENLIKKVDRLRMLLAEELNKDQKRTMVAQLTDEKRHLLEKKFKLLKLKKEEFEHLKSTNKKLEQDKGLRQYKNEQVPVKLIFGLCHNPKFLPIVIILQIILALILLFNQF